MYTCKTCGQTAEELTGWKIVGVQFLSMNPTIPDPPGGRTLESQAPDMPFDTDECLESWCTQAAVPPPDRPEPLA